MNYANSMLSGVRAHRVGVVERKAEMRMLAHTRLTAISNQFTGRLFDKMVTKSLNRSYLVLLPAFIPTHEYVRHFNVNSRDASEAVRIGSRYRKSVGICAVREK
jgi:hypothetical protein